MFQLKVKYSDPYLRSYWIDDYKLNTYLYSLLSTTVLKENVMSPRPAGRVRTRGTLSFYRRGGRARRKTPALNGGGLFSPAISFIPDSVKICFTICAFHLLSETHWKPMHCPHKFIQETKVRLIFFRRIYWNVYNYETVKIIVAMSVSVLRSA